MDLFHVIFRHTIQSIVIGMWSLVLLALLVGLVGRMIYFVWAKLHSVRAIVRITGDDEVVDAEWVREI